MELDLAPMTWATDLPVETCLERIRARTMEDRFWSTPVCPPDRTILSEVRGTHVKLYATRRFRRTAEPYFSGALTTRQGRTWISGRFVVWPIALVVAVLFQAGFLGCALLLGVAALFGKAPWGGAAACAGIGIAFVAFSVFGWLSSEDQRTQVKQFIERDLEATPRPLP
jgi:hypothetical protein